MNHLVLTIVKEIKTIFDKKQALYLILALLSFCVAFTSHVSAQEPNIQSKETEIPIPVEQIRTPRVGEQKNLLDEHTRNRVINLAQNVAGRMIAAVERLTQIAGRIESRIEKMENQGESVSVAWEHLARAQTLLTTAGASLDTITPAIHRTTDSDTPGKAFIDLKKRFTTTRDHIREAHGYLGDALTALKDPTQNGVVSSSTPNFSANATSTNDEANASVE